MANNSAFYARESVSLALLVINFVFASSCQISLNLPTPAQPQTLTCTKIQIWKNSKKNFQKEFPKTIPKQFQKKFPWEFQKEIINRILITKIFSLLLQSLTPFRACYLYGRPFFFMCTWFMVISYDLWFMKEYQNCSTRKSIFSETESI